MEVIWKHFIRGPFEKSKITDFWHPTLLRQSYSFSFVLSNRHLHSCLWNNFYTIQPHAPTNNMIRTIKNSTPYQPRGPYTQYAMTNMKTSNFNQSNLQQPPSATFDDEDTIDFTRWMVYLFFRKNILKSNTFSVLFYSLFGFSRPNRAYNIDWILILSIIMTSSITKGNYWNIRIVTF